MSVDSERREGERRDDTGGREERRRQRRARESRRDQCVGIYRGVLYIEGVH